LLGGFTTQNTDAEWSDARQSYAATILLDYFRATANTEYLERAVAAARSTLAVAPWENWAHTGYIDEPGSLTGFHWGTGSAMTSVEIMSPVLGDALIDLKTGVGVGFDDCSVENLRIEPGRIVFDIKSPAKGRDFIVLFRGVDPSQRYQIVWNGRSAHEISGERRIVAALRSYRIDGILLASAAIQHAPPWDGHSKRRATRGGLYLFQRAESAGYRFSYWERLVQSSLGWFSILTPARAARPVLAIFSQKPVRGLALLSVAYGSRRSPSVLPHLYLDADSADWETAPAALDNRLWAGAGS
jgi:hypothetical protein